MVKIAPSVLSCDFSRFGDECREVLNEGADWLHIDVMDGVFVPNLSLGIGELKSITKAVEAFYDVHLMIIDPLKYIDRFSEAGANMITFHLESDSDVKETIKRIRENGCMAGISIKPATPAQTVFELLREVDMVLVMTVEPGFGGQSFREDACKKVAEIRDKAQELGLSELLIQVDGGIAPDTAVKAREYGANVLVAGSSIFGKADRGKAIREIRG